MSTGEAEINPDGTTTFASYQAGDGGPSSSASADDGGAEDATSSSSSFFEATAGDMVTKRTDPAIYLGLALLIAGIFAVFYYRNLQKMRQKELQDLDFLSTVDGEKFNLKLPAAVDEYYAIKLKCEEQGWAPSSSTSTNNATAGDSPHHRVLAQALMKRCIADIPLVQHIQKESSGMNKLYAQSMCSVKQWRAYQAAESMVSTEVDEVRAEADEIEPGWSQLIWRQAMQYHNMLKQKHEHEAKAAAEAAEKKRLEQAKVNAERQKILDEKARIEAAERAAQELINQEEREKNSKKSFNGSGLKKGFLK